ncbi:hypothetical protein NXS98_09950 [Fontisphaera persica]|uniref:hypothetical protein n=1 Tax=Fontisphaera persica TaxID=2974023 RepID=UPI0024BFA63A|nr:hypothetical protein [Fontisphaera persica]WCJ58049.1 hypothetical protein NXS98_09950 [Fontisphaera persica]
MMQHFWFWVALHGWLAVTALATDYVLVAPETAPIHHGAQKLEAALRKQGHTLSRQPAGASRTADVVVTLKRGLAGAAQDGFTLANAGGKITLTGGERGAMYGLLTLAEHVRQGRPLTQIESQQVQPVHEFRAIKFNLPWAAYRTSPALEQHSDTCKDLRFWEAFLDMMAENRFNVLTLWSLHPFPFMVRPKNFPEACPLNDAELAEMRKLWRGLFALAQARGIETYLINWNIFVTPQFARAHHVARWSETWSHYGDGDKNPLLIRYTREVVAQVLEEYPELTGLGITLGERMGGMTPDERRDWLEPTFFAAMASVQRPVKFIYRAPLSANTGSGGTTSAENDRRTRAQIERLPANIPTPVYVEFKHNWSHAHSSPDLFMVHGGPLSDAYWNPPPTRHKVVWTMRNEDMFILRWGEPDFVRAFLSRQRAPHVGGALLGSECYIPALDYITAPGAHKTWRYAFERQWLFYAVWGRLLHDPATPDSVFERLLEERFGPGLGPDLLRAWKLASRVPLHFASFHRGTWDGNLYTEGFSSWTENGPRKFFDVDSFITHPVLDTKRYVNIADFVKAGGVVEAGKHSPLSLAEELERNAAESARLAAVIRQRARPNPTLECELNDIEAWAAYAQYFAEKLQGGVALAQARAKGSAEQQQQAVAALERALQHWKRLAALGEKFNQLPILSNSAQPFSWAQLTPEVERDLERARAPLPPARPTR